MALLTTMEAKDYSLPPATAPSRFSTPKKSNPFPIGKLPILVWGCLLQMIKMKFVNPKFLYLLAVCTCLRRCIEGGCWNEI
jgi:hypothetical protein